MFSNFDVVSTKKLSTVIVEDTVISLGLRGFLFLFKNYFTTFPLFKNLGCNPEVFLPIKMY